MHHPPGDCPTVMEDVPPSPIRRVAQVQQQVEQVIQQELDTLHVQRHRIQSIRVFRLAGRAILPILSVWEVSANF
jgi:hypothetical protein